MVKREIKNSLSEDDGESNIINENGKRIADSGNKEGKKRIKTKSLYRQPTANELNRLQETENLFNSNLFRLQVEEILQEVKVKEKTIKRFQEWFTHFKTHLLSIPENEKEYNLSDKTFSKQFKVKLPINDTLETTKVMFKFYKFSNIEIVGSYNLGCSINSKLVIDLQITVPADTYTKNDSVNYKYHKKRAAYLAYIASYLTKLEIIENLQYSFKNACETKPILIIKPHGKLGNHISVHLDVVCEIEAYKLHRFSPTRNNLRESWLFSMDNQENTEVGPPTPYYNSSVLSDLTNSVNQEYLKQILINCENLKQAVVLLKIWVRQRNLQVSGYIISMIIAYLVQAKRINNIMSSYQIVRNVWIALKSSEWDKQGISVCKDQGSPSLEEFHEHFPVVFLDKTGYYNILWQMSSGTYSALKRESALAIDMLDNAKINSFIPLFMTPVKVLMQFDHILKFKNFNEIKQSILDKAPKPLRINYGLDYLTLVTDTLSNLLTKGLGDRVDLILPIVEADFSWSVKKSLEKEKKDNYKEKLTFGFILNHENAINIVDRGPPANLPKAEEFRAFWGDKSELRRFQDGSITEACVWSADTLADRRNIPAQIIDYLLQIKYAIPPEQIFHINSQLNDLLVRKSAQCQQMEEMALPVLQAFDELRRDMRGLTQLPLEISAVYGTSPVFSYCEPCPPCPARAPAPSPARGARRGGCALLPPRGSFVPEYTPASDVVVELTHSGKWPGDIDAFRCLKAAFHLQIAERLNKQYSLLTQAYDTHVDVLKNGLVFRLRVAHPKEITLLRREIERGVVKFKETEESSNLQLECFLLPRLRGALHGLHQRHPAYGATVCLFKRWLSCHLLAHHIPSTAAELLVAAVFLVPAPLSAPAQPTLGLLRVLRLLADKDWEKEMLVLDFNDDMSREEISEIERKFAARESSSPYMYIATSYDGDARSPWTAGAGARAVLRARALASAALRHAETALLQEMQDNILQVFVPSLSGYDVVVRLRTRLVPHSSERLQAPPSPRAPHHPPGTGEELIPVVDFHPVNRYLEELKSAYGEFAEFFHDAYGGDIVAVLWKPDIHELRDLQIANANALKPVTINGEIKYKVNIEAIVEDFKILGAGLVADVTVNTN